MEYTGSIESPIPKQQYMVGVLKDEIAAGTLQQELNANYINGWKLHTIDLTKGIVVYERIDKK
ncbi:hypothetical protein [Tumebacillus permanentifrigoris]|uniref:DUF4177 domain-containing protein n=1 Tax=Tumebacillus permanentifrigoris TaxID=378543 RepID=A0A316DC04_9BACL|nr:hypothetical protein [Tumebacillus permanentifrigoris]PWK15731.1 hypothetical protein C7459_103283 [Tumebacillus permanentifrigoris]